MVYFHLHLLRVNLESVGSCCAHVLRSFNAKKKRWLTHCHNRLAGFFQGQQPSTVTINRKKERKKKNNQKCLANQPEGEKATRRNVSCIFRSAAANVGVTSNNPPTPPASCHFCHGTFGAAGLPKRSVGEASGVKRGSQSQSSAPLRLSK